MRFTPEFLDEIKARLRVSDVVGRRVRLKRQGREWRGLSPFNSEKTPSFYVNDAKMAWFDFSAGRNGNVFDFVMATEGLTFPEAVERLAGEAGLALPEATRESVERERRRAGLVEVLEMAAAFFERTLKGPGGARGRDYLARRGIAPALQATFRLGFAPNERFALRDHLAAKGADVEVMIEAGLLVHGEGIAVPYDRFRDRVVFPIEDRSGRVIAFGGRALDPLVPAKYLNSPETPLFHKGANLYNQHRARKAAQERGTVVAVEGYVDVIALHAAGFPHVVAGLGTALTAEQCDLLWRLAPEPVLCFDGDGAGRRAAAKALDTALPLLRPDRTLRFAFLPDGKDPDDLARAGGAAAVAAVLDAARPLVDVLWGREAEGAALDTPERRAGLRNRLGDLARQIGDETLRRYYAQELYGRLDALTGGSRASAGRPRFAAQPGSGRSQSRPRFDSPLARSFTAAPAAKLGSAFGGPPRLPAQEFRGRDAEILTIVMNHPPLLDRHAEDLVHLSFDSPELSRLRDLMIELLADHFIDHEAFKAAVDARGAGDLRRRVEAVAARAPLWSTSAAAALSDAEESLRQALALHRRARELSKELLETASALGREESESRLAQLRDLQTQLSALDGTEATVDGYGVLSGHKPADAE